MNITEALKTRRIYFDGAMGSMIDPADIPEGSIPESMLLRCPEKIESIHRAYIDAGADVIITATFGANRAKLSKYGMDVKEIYDAGVRCVKKAAEGAGRRIYVAGDIGPLGRLLSPIGDLAFEDAYDMFYEMAECAEKAGADLILVETMNDAYELKAAVLAAKEATSLPIVATVVVDEDGKLLTGAPIEGVGALLEDLGVDICGINCGFGPDKAVDAVKRLYESCSLPIVAEPNAGLPRATATGKAVYDMDADTYGEWMTKIAPYASALGGCCGTTPLYIKTLIERTAEMPLPPDRHPDRTIVSSGMEAVEISPDHPVIIGERINPTGKKLLKEALRSGDMGYILGEGIRQQENGAHILDVNTGMPGIDEASAMVNVLHQLQGVVSCPVQIDTADITALEKALRMVNGKPLVNSVNGKPESMAAVFPLVKKYGGVVVGLTLDENGIPATAEGRFNIAEKLVNKAAEYGISRKDIIIDPLAMAVSAGVPAEVTLDTITMIRERLGVNTILGVSNISFGLPARENINAAFLSMALKAGLTAAIMNPMSEKMMDAWYSSMVLTDRDKNCDNYSSLYSGKKAEITAAAADADLFSAITAGLSSEAVSAAKAELLNSDPLDLIEGKLIPALDDVGRKFEEKTLFLPQLLMSAQAADAAFGEIRKVIEMKGAATDDSKKVIVATVHGDIHDIGKNIVKVLLQSYGFNVIDLGKDIPARTVVDAAIKNDIKLVGLSALMTTTLPAMKETIELLNSECPGCRVVVGGAVLTEDYALSIGADKYARTAMDTVKYAQEILE